LTRGDLRYSILVLRCPNCGFKCRVPDYMLELARKDTQSIHFK